MSERAMADLVKARHVEREKHKRTGYAFFRTRPLQRFRPVYV